MQFRKKVYGGTPCSACMAYLHRNNIRLVLRATQIFNHANHGLSQVSLVQLNIHVPGLNDSESAELIYNRAINSCTHILRKRSNRIRYFPLYLHRKHYDDPFLYSTSKHSCYSYIHVAA